VIRNFAALTPATGRLAGLLRIAGAATLACLLLACVRPPGASANVAREIAERCGHQQSLAGYTVKQYQEALKKLPTEVLEYSSCAEEIQRAELEAAGHGHGAGGQGGTGGGGSGGLPGSGASPGGGAVQAVQPTPAQQKVLERTRTGSAPTVHLGGANNEPVAPGVVHADLASATSNLPAPVLAVIAAVIAGVALLAGREIHARMQRSQS
jgi:hypothetical protein